MNQDREYVSGCYRKIRRLEVNRDELDLKIEKLYSKNEETQKIMIETCKKETEDLLKETEDIMRAIKLETEDRVSKIEKVFLEMPKK